MKVMRDKKYAAVILKAIIDNYTATAKIENAKRAKDKLWHVSDLVTPRQTYYNITQGRKITNKAIGFWFTGKAYATELQRILGNAFAEVEAKWKQVVAHIDHKEKALIEIKTSRKWTIPEQPSPHYTRQVAYYCAMTGTKSAKIVVIFPTAGRTFGHDKSSTVDVAVWEVSFTEAELARVRVDMEETIKQIQIAVKKKDPKNLPACPKWWLEDFKKADAGRYNEKEDYAQPFNYIDMRVKYA